MFRARSAQLPTPNLTTYPPTNRTLVPTRFTLMVFTSILGRLVSDVDQNLKGTWFSQLGVPGALANMRLGSQGGIDKK